MTKKALEAYKQGWIAGQQYKANGSDYDGVTIKAPLGTVTVEGAGISRTVSKGDTLTITSVPPGTTKVTITFS